MPYGPITHADVTHVMGTLTEPVSPFYRYHAGQYVYVHQSACNHSELDALECYITDVSGAPLEIKVFPCNHPEDVRTVRQDQLSAPIEV